MTRPGRANSEYPNRDFLAPSGSLMVDFDRVLSRFEEAVLKQILRILFRDETDHLI